MNINEIGNKIAEADLVLVGLGEEFSNVDNSVDDLLKAYNKISDLLGEKNYFIVTISDDNTILESTLKADKITAPYVNAESEGEESESDESWEKYMKWLSCTLNRKLLVIEFGVSLGQPQIIRWPFEKTVMFNNKAELIRINNSIPNIPAEIKDKALSIKANAVDFILESVLN